MGLISGILFGIIFGVALMAGWSRMMTHRSSKRVAKVRFNWISEINLLNLKLIEIHYLVSRLNHGGYF